MVSACQFNPLRDRCSWHHCLRFRVEGDTVKSGVSVRWEQFCNDLAQNGDKTVFLLRESPSKPCKGHIFPKTKRNNLTDVHGLPSLPHTSSCALGSISLPWQHTKASPRKRERVWLIFGAPSSFPSHRSVTEGDFESIEGPGWTPNSLNCGKVGWGPNEGLLAAAFPVNPTVEGFQSSVSNWITFNCSNRSPGGCQCC